MNIDYSKSINEQELLKDTRIILSLIYRDYICSKEEKNELLLKDKKEIEEQERILQEKYQIDFGKRKDKITEKTYEEVETTEITVVKEKWYHKLFRFLFRRNKR